MSMLFVMVATLIMQPELTRVWTENILYQGCRSASKDKHYGDEFASYASDNHAGAPKLEYRVACSRDGPPGVKRTYVQDLIREDSERIADLVRSRGGFVYISG